MLTRKVGVTDMAMIKLFDYAVNEDAVISMVKRLESCGVTPEAAERLTDSALSIALAFIRGLDAKIEAESTDPNDQQLIQLAVMFSLGHTCSSIMKHTFTLEALRNLGIAID